MNLPAVIILADNEEDAAELDALRRNTARHLARCADRFRAEGNDELAERFELASIRFAPETVN